MKEILFISLLVSVLFAIKIDVKVDENKSITPTNREKDAFKSFSKETMRFNISDQGAYNLIKENRALANEYIKKFGISEFDKARLKVESEMYLANKMIKTIQQSISIPYEVLYSYYLDNKNQFKEGDKVDAIMFFFIDPDKAIDFYLKVKNEKINVNNLAKEFNFVQKKHVDLDVEKLKPVIKTILKKSKKKKYLLPPLIGSKYSVVMYIEKYKKSKGYKPFDKVKSVIEKKLYNETFIKKRNEILKKYGVKND